MTDAGLVTAFDRTMGALKILGLALGIGGALMLTVGGLVVAAHVGGFWGVFFFAVYLGCAVVGLTDWYASRLRSRRL